jgi:ribosomal protein S18 acetylase RimI-like enzyme
MHIRQTTIHDAALLARLNMPIQQLHADAVPARFKAPLLDDPAVIAFYEERLSNEDWVGYVAENEHEALGYVLCAIQRSPENPFKYAETTLLVDQLSINPEHQRQGCGQALMQAAFDFAHEVGASSVMLSVWEFNQQAQAFYKAQDFQYMTHRLQYILAK